MFDQKVSVQFWSSPFKIFLCLYINYLHIFPHVPVRIESTRADIAPSAIARLTADRTASSEAVTILGCIPAPNKVRRARVVISIEETGWAPLPLPRECSSYDRTSKGSAAALTMASMGPDPCPSQVSKWP